MGFRPGSREPRPQLVLVTQFVRELADQYGVPFAGLFRQTLKEFLRNSDLKEEKFFRELRYMSPGELEATALKLRVAAMLVLTELMPEEALGLLDQIIAAHPNDSEMLAALRRIRDKLMRQQRLEDLAHPAEDIEDLIRQVWLRFIETEPWSHLIGPFWLDLSRIHPEFARVDVRLGGFEKIALIGITWQVYEDPNFVDMLIEFDPVQPKSVDIVTHHWKKHTAEDLHLVLVCVWLAIIDFVTRTIVFKVGPARRRVQHDIDHPRLPKDFEAEHTIYVPRREVIRLGGTGEVIERAHPTGIKRARHFCPAHIRHRPMSEEQERKLLELLAEGIVLTDRLGQPIPMPTHREYTIVLGHPRGQGEPKPPRLVSKSVEKLLDAYEEETPDEDTPAG